MSALPLTPMPGRTVVWNQLEVKAVAHATARPMLLPTPLRKRGLALGGTLHRSTTRYAAHPLSNLLGTRSPHTQEPHENVIIGMSQQHLQISPPLTKEGPEATRMMAWQLCHVPVHISVRASVKRSKMTMTNDDFLPAHLVHLSPCPDAGEVETMIQGPALARAGATTTRIATMPIPSIQLVPPRLHLVPVKQ